MNITDLELAIGQKISAASTNLELLQYARMLQQLQNGAVFAAATASSLPTASQNTGKIYLVEDIQTTVYSNGVNWVNLAGRKPLTQVWTWGLGCCGQLGTNIDYAAKSSPVLEISSSCNWCIISAGACVTVGIKNNGSLWAWGVNTAGAVGDNTTTSRSSPVREISSSTNWCQASGGYRHTAAIKSTGTLWTWGCNSWAVGPIFGGNLGDNTTINRSSPVQEISSSTNWCQVSVSWAHSIGLKNDGSLWLWGLNNKGQLGDNTTTCRSSPVRELTSGSTWSLVTAAYTHTVAIKTAGTLWAWGGNACGAIGDSTTTDKSSPVQEITGSTNWRIVAGNGASTVAIKADNTLWGWGYGFRGGLGDGTTNNRSSPVQEITSSALWCQVKSYAHTAAIRTDGTLWTWGRNLQGQLGDNTSSNRCSPVREITSSCAWSAVSVTFVRSAALKIT